jgi:hypothetical protein
MMTTENLFYWLQGYFELTRSLSEEDRELPATFYDCILAHIEVCKKSKQSDNQRLNKLRDELEFVAKYRVGAEAVKKLIHSAFAHVIDKDNNVVHESYGSWDSGEMTMRC